MRRLPTATAITAVVALMLGVLGFAVSAIASPASAETSTTIINEGSPDGFVAVIKVSGFLDPVMVDFIETSVDEAVDEGALALVLQVDSEAVVVDDSVFAELLEAMLASPVPIDVWVGPSGSHLTGLAAQLVGAAGEVGMAPGSKLGNSGPPVIDGLDTKRLAPITEKTVSAEEAADLGVTTIEAPTIGDFLVNLPGVATREVVSENGETRREPLTQVRFGQLSLVSNLMHTVASPAVAYLLITIGLALILFELFTAGVGIAGVVGAVSFVLAGYGMWVLPTHWWAFILLAMSMFAFAIDVQTGVPRVWTGIGVVLFLAFSFTVFDGMSLSWITLLVAVIGIVLTFVAGMPSMVRTRFSTPTIGREWMIGEMGRAVTGLNPDGVVQIRDALWRASTNRATPIEELDRVRVVSIDGLVLEVEPETGAAKDYRDRSGGSDTKGDNDSPENSGSESGRSQDPD
ncbi:MAG: NfeD family protein [Acidimicrobiales bacterium]